MLGRIEGIAMSDQPPVQPPNNPPPVQPSNQPTEGNPPTQPMSAAPGAPPVGSTDTPAPAYPPKQNVWHQATSTKGRRWALALSAGALALLLLFGIGIAGWAVLRFHDRVNLLGNRQDGHSLGRDGNGNGSGFGDGRGPGTNDGRDRRNVPGPGLPGGRALGPGVLGNLLGGTALHGEVTANANGSVQALVFQRGEVTAVSGTSITLKSSDGFGGTYARTSATRSRGADPVQGGQAFVLARASDKVAIAIIGTLAQADATPST